ncbi:hypothetical protein B0675_02370 [Streptomyces sp. M41(2017)]|uniref:hypothetical protein n=1 Tax=Streptomyces sp. M41(2017) TaxID=1955065 RepID=UPI0009F10DDF|nr:hypothetical protein [Streptomyces sp. M41(2017)]OQQ16148.1 hypothetical protein B0675_02370 [Streptomyces sp. M41(2017)]
MPASLFPSVMRTVIPLIAGWLLSLAVQAGVTIDSESVTTAVTVALVLAYYLVFRLLEVIGTKLRGTALQKAAGFLLGWARPPAYPDTGGALPPAPATGDATFIH